LLASAEEGERRKGKSSSGHHHRKRSSDESSDGVRTKMKKDETAPSTSRIKDPDLTSLSKRNLTSSPSIHTKIHMGTALTCVNIS